MDFLVFANVSASYIDKNKKTKFISNTYYVKFKVDMPNQYLETSKGCQKLYFSGELIKDTNILDPKTKISIFNSFIVKEHTPNIKRKLVYKIDVLSISCTTQHSRSSYCNNGKKLLIEITHGTKISSSEYLTLCGDIISGIFDIQNIDKK